ncbi:hypothetical protein MMC11_002317 [Xylographa trunciseda]|nr:hypothetical protein [Xylographa trunciseda]
MEEGMVECPVEWVECQAACREGASLVLVDQEASQVLEPGVMTVLLWKRLTRCHFFSLDLIFLCSCVLHVAACRQLHVDIDLGSHWRNHDSDANGLTNHGGKAEIGLL